MLRDSKLSPTFAALAIQFAKSFGFDSRLFCVRFLLFYFYKDVVYHYFNFIKKQLSRLFGLHAESLRKFQFHKGTIKCKMFQSTHPRRVRLAALLAFCHYYMFQSTHPRRVRLDSRRDVFADCRFQSTHPRRVRPNISRNFGRVTQFQSTHPRRVRLVIVIFSLFVIKFQSTHPRRVRLVNIEPRENDESFNPRTHVGCDVDLCQVHNIMYEFQSTHPRRVRPQRTAVK